MFLRALGARIDKALFVLTGGCNLRFFHHSVRYSGDMDLDIRTMAPAMLRSNVDQVITGHALRQSLLAQGLLIVDAISPKQTTTTQHRKVSLRDTDSETCVPARVGFSQRNLGEGVRLEAITPGIQHAYRICPVLVQHYDAEAALRQRINALAQRKHTQARNLFDIQLLLDGGAGKTPFTPQMRAISASAVERALEIGFRRSRRTGDGVSG
jgi:hypothetical protein